MTTRFGDSKYDLRILEQSFREGKITKKDLEQYLKGLPDEASNAEEVKVSEDDIKTPLSPEDRSQDEDEKTPHAPTFSA